MGIGIALATGLVQGFHQNIQEEKARRQGEQEKLDEYKKLVLDASLTSKNFSQTNADVINKMIASAQGRIDSRERINIFGQQGERVDVDFSDLVSKLTTTAKTDEFTTDFFGLTIPVQEKYSDYEGTNRGDSMLYSALNNFRLKNPGAMEAHFQANPELFGDARQEMVNMGKGTLRFSAQNSTGDTPFTVNVSELPGYEDFFNPFFSISKTAQFKMQFESVRDQMKDNGDENFDNPNLIPLSGSIFVNAVNEKGEPVNPTSADMVPMLWTDLEGMDEDRWNAVGRIAELQGRDVGHFMFDFSKQYDNITELNNALMVATDLVALGAAKGNARTGEDILKMGEYIYRSPRLKDDVYMQASVFLAFQPLAMDSSEKSMIDAGIIPQVTVGKGEAFKAQFENLVGITYAKFQTKLTGVTGAQTKLKKYRAMVAELDVTKDSVLEDIVRIVTSIFGETGKIDQIANLMGLSEDEYEGDGIAAFIEKDQRRLAKKRGKAYSIDELISSTDALAYIIAADLARAEDDQGRLSDADIERNLNKIRGFGATTVNGQLAAIDTVMATIDNQARSLAVLDRVSQNAMPSGVITREERRLLAADKQARLARTRYLNSIAGISKEFLEDEQKLQETTVESLRGGKTPEKAATFISGDGTEYYQVDGNYFTVTKQGETEVVNVIDEGVFTTAFQAYKNTPSAAAPAAAPSGSNFVNPDFAQSRVARGEEDSPVDTTTPVPAAAPAAAPRPAAANIDYEGVVAGEAARAAAPAAAPSDADLVRQQIAQAAAASNFVNPDFAQSRVARGEEDSPVDTTTPVTTDMNLLPDETGATRYSDQNPVQPLRKFATAGKQYILGSDPTIVGFQNLVNSNGTPRMFKKVFENGKLIGYREMKTRPSQ
jgi:hypothetical protein